MISKRDSSWNSIQDAILGFTKKVAGPSRGEKQKLLGGGNNRERLETLLSGCREQRFGKNVIVMVGAGVSVAAGFPDFRDKESGVYAKIRKQHGITNPESIFTHQGYETNPGPLNLWLQEFLDVREKANPTVTHLFLQLLEEKGCLQRCYTQNIDGLELAAGLPRERVVMAHGNMRKPSCVACKTPYPAAEHEKEVRAGGIPTCRKVGCGKPIRPDITFFSEPSNIPPSFQSDFDKCDLLIVLGTSLNVNPFANLAARVPLLCPRLLINRDKVLIDNCRHASRQLVFDGPKAFRDVWIGGQSDESVRVLANELGWHQDLLNLEGRFRGMDPRRVRIEVPHEMGFADMVITPASNSTTREPSGCGTRETSDDGCVSELSCNDLTMVEDRLAEIFRGMTPESSHLDWPDNATYYSSPTPTPRASPTPSMDTLPGIKQVTSHGSLASMVSDLSCGNEQKAPHVNLCLEMIDVETGSLVTI